MKPAKKGLVFLFYFGEFV